MTPDERDALIDRLTVMAEYYERPKSDAQITLYVQGLDDLPYESVARALSDLVRTSTFYPKISEIRAQAEGSLEDEADEAWHELHAEFRRVGSWSKPNLTPATQETMLMLCGNWERACALIGQASEGPAIQGWQKRWREAYGSTRGRIARGELIGRDEAKQLLAGIPKQLPAGDEREVPAVPQGVSVASDLHPQRRRDG